MRILIVAAVVTSAWIPAMGEDGFESVDIFPPQEKHVHGSSIVACGNGDLLACWFHGSGERSADDVLVQGARRKQGESEWGPVFVMADTPGLPDCNPVLYIDKDERLCLFWIAVLAKGWEHSLLRLQRAEAYEGDGPPQWNWGDTIVLKPGERFAETMKERFEELNVDTEMWAEYALPYERMLLEAAQDPIKRQMGWMTRIHPLTLPSGRILLPLYSDGFNAGLVAISDDTGETWRASGPMIGLGPIQPTLVRHANGDIAAYLRDSGGPPYRVMHCVSKDEGETWSAARDTEVPNPGSSLEVIALRDGAWLMVCNDTVMGRSRLTALVSKDEGKTWPAKRKIEPSENGGRSFGYPSVFQAKGGGVHMTYTTKSEAGKTIRHTIVTRDWLEASEK